MFRVSQSEFEELVNHAIDALPKKYLKKLNNVVIVTEDKPTPEQHSKLHLHNGETLYGLYEGIPMTQRGTNYSMVLPDKITIFKLPIEYGANNFSELKEQVRHTLWHEVAHFFGLNHDAIYERDGTRPTKK